MYPALNIKNNVINSVAIRIYDLFRKDLHLPEAKAKEFVEAIAETSRECHEENMDSLATKAFMHEEMHRIELEIRRVELAMANMRTDFTKSIFWGNFIQFIGVVASLIAILSFMLK